MEPWRTRHDRLVYLKSREVARRIGDDPSLLHDAVRFLSVDDGLPAAYREMWLVLLRDTPERIGAALLEDSPRGQLLRETQPVFGQGFTSQEVRALLATTEP